MARVWTEPADESRHTDFMRDRSVGGHRLARPRDNLLRQRVLLVEVCGFTFQFHSRQQLEEAVSFFSRAIHKTSMRPNIDLEHHWQPWSQRLPRGFTGRSKRLRILAALKKAAGSELIMSDLPL